MMLSPSLGFGLTIRGTLQLTEVSEHMAAAGGQLPTFWHLHGCDGASWCVYNRFLADSHFTFAP